MGRIAIISYELFFVDYIDPRLIVHQWMEVKAVLRIAMAVKIIWYSNGGKNGKLIEMFEFGIKG